MRDLCSREQFRRLAGQWSFEPGKQHALEWLTTAARAALDNGRRARACGPAPSVL
jgi:hypothetical protein